MGWQGIAQERLVAVVATLPGGRMQIGSGYLVTADLVLTAAHCTLDKSSGRSAVALQVVRESDGAARPVEDERVLRSAAVLDLAALRLVDPPWSASGQSWERPTFARVSRTHTAELKGCEAAGYPLFQQDPGDLQRNLAELHGDIRLLEDAGSGLLVMRDAGLVTVTAPRSTSTREPQQAGWDSPWGGLSGALVFHQGLALGVIVEHHPRQGGSAVRIMPIERLAVAGDADSRAVADALNLIDVDRLPWAAASRTPGPRRTSAASMDLFVGREHNLIALTRLVDEEVHEEVGQRPIGLLGMGGVGKTSLASELIRRLVDGYPGRELLMLRADFGYPQAASKRLFRRWAVEMGLPEEREYDATAMRHHLGAHYDARICLIDDAWMDEIAEIRSINEALPATWTRLVTTRDRAVCTALGARIYPVGPLSERESLDLVGVQLHRAFDHASALGPAGVDRAIETHHDALVRLVTEVDGLPLALRLGIGSCNSLAEIPRVVQRLVRSLQLGVDKFMTGAMEVADRNLSLAASLSTSYRDLEQDSQRLGLDWAERFSALGVFPDGCKLAAEFVLALWGDPPDSDDGLEALDGLVTRCLLDADVDSGDYAIHPVLRAYASGLLRRHHDDLEATRHRYYRVVVEHAKAEYAEEPWRWSASDYLYPHLAHVLPELAASLEEESARTFDDLAAAEVPDSVPFDNLRAVAQDLVDLGTEVAAVFARAASLRPWWGEVGTHLLKLGVICARANHDHHTEAEYLGRLGSILARSSSTRARPYFDAAVRLGHEYDAPTLGDILTFYAESRRVASDWPAALELAAEGLEIHQAAGRARREATTRMVMGEVLWRQSRLEEAAEQYELARSLFEKEHNAKGIADVLNKMASVEFNRGGRYEEAIRLFTEALVKHEAINDRVMKAEDLNDLGACYRYLGRYSEALDHFTRALEINRAMGSRRLEAINLCNIAGVYYAQGQLDLSGQAAREGQRLAAEVSDRIPQIWGLVWEGLAWQGMDDTSEAERCLVASVDLARAADNPRGLAGALARLGLLVTDVLGRPEEGAVLIDEAIALLEDHGMVTAFSNISLAELRTRRSASPVPPRR